MTKKQNKKKEELPSKTITLHIGENEYEVKFPTNGQLIDIETTRQALAVGQMDNILLTRSGRSSLAYVTIDMVAHFTHLIPQLNKDMRVNSLLQLNAFETKQLKHTYITEFSPWYDKWIEIINSDYVPENVVEDEDEDEDIGVVKS